MNICFYLLYIFEEPNILTSVSSKQFVIHVPRIFYTLFQIHDMFHLPIGLWGLVNNTGIIDQHFISKIVQHS